ncbi:MAG: hypothetical protein IPK80_00840 [Nannocystis sp.]|nr:hypothetical protein [Nannocystis sp.]
MSFAHAASAPEPRFPQPPAGHRDWYAFEAIRALPRILLMVDKNPLSPTYGCFDRDLALPHRRLSLRHEPGVRAPARPALSS